MENQKKKLSLENIQVESFVTALDKDAGKTIGGIGVSRQKIDCYTYTIDTSDGTRECTC